MRINLFIILMLIASSIFADKIYLKDSKKTIEGEVIEQTDEYIVIKEQLPPPFTGYSTRIIPISTIKERKTTEELYLEKIKYEEEQKAKGLVKYKDKWVTPEEKNKLEMEEMGKSTRELKEQVSEIEKKLFGTPIGNGFYVKNVTFRHDYGMLNIIGEMSNNSGINYTLANFIISLYDDDGNLLGIGYINISNFLNGQTKAFNGLAQVGERAKYKYKIQFENGF